ncbi:hypothetical protein EGW08_012163 [Elysia chlorotica]|uniref:Reverse transcriptase domain-containing protein n=1 Tax=Elysia chlorotica TaxID=188477 RepID=A0A3S1BBB4_ELYCH|nr:hypothetical protein EGW08_012163 [Elysia chlorotica]
MSLGVASALLARKVALRTGKWTSEPIEINPGLPQGSPLSSVLFNIYTAGVAETDRQSGKTLKFADDIMVYEKGTDRIQTAQQLQTRLDEIAIWCEENNAIINPDKAQVLWCSLNNNIVHTPTPPITFKYEVIERETTLKYLGITFDRTLSFNQHIENVSRKVKKGIGAIKTMASAHIQQNVLFVMFQLLILSVLDYGLGCLTLSEANLLKLERLQNEAMRAVLGCTRDTHIICMRFLLDLSSVRIRHKLAQAKTYLRVMENPHHPLYPSLLTQKGTRIKRGKSWMAEAEDSIKLVCPIEDIIDGREWIKTGPEQTALTKVIITMGRDRRECAAAVTEQDIRQLIHDNSKRHDPIIYTDGSVKRGIQSGWGFVCYSENRVIHEESGAAATTTSSMKMEIEAITKALEWIKLTRPTTTHAVFLTDSQSALKKIECGFMRMKWMTAIRPTAISSITWIFCPGHAGVKGNERADKLAGNATGFHFLYKYL